MDLNRNASAKFTVSSAAGVEGTTIILLGGEVDLSNVNQLRPELEKVPNDTQSLVIDLADLSFFDSSGIALLVEIAEKVPSLELRNASPLICRIVEATGLSEVLKVAP